jgi:DNA polymerase-3 subunit delta
MAKKTEINELSALKGAIKAKTLGRFYIFHGEEMFLLRYYLEQMKKILVDDLTESFNYTRLTAETFELQTFVDAVESFPMMADSTMVVVDDVDLFKLPETERNKLTEVFSDIPDYCTVVFTYETVAWKPDKRYKKFWEAIEGSANIVEFAKQDQRDLIAWVQRHFAAAKKQIVPELCAYLIDITGGTMTALAGEISKIVSYSGAEHICKADIDAVVEPVLDAVVFQMTDMLSQGNYGGALLKLQTLLKMQQEPIPILGAIGGALRRIATARILLDNGRPASELQKLCAPMTDYAARKNMEAARRFSPEFCRKAAQLVVETDYKMKTSFDEQERLLELLILQLAKEAGRG